MGAGNKLDPSRFRVCDISKTSVCPAGAGDAPGIEKARHRAHLKVVFSDEPPLPPKDGARAPASISFVPTAAGLVLAGAIVRDLIGAECARKLRRRRDAPVAGSVAHLWR